MSSFKLVIDLADGTRIWVNMFQIVKMQKDTAGRYFIFLTNGECYEVDRRTASTVEEFLED